MRTRIASELPPDKAHIERILRFGVRGSDSEAYRCFLKRLKTACYLTEDELSRPRSAKERLLAQYQKDGLVLFLGAGVSTGSGIPNWNSLIEGLLRKMGLDPCSVVRAFPLLISQFQAACLAASGQNHFLESLYDCLYGQEQCKALKRLLTNIPRERDKQSGWVGWKQILDRMAMNETLRDVGDLLIFDDAEIQANSRSGRCPSCGPPYWMTQRGSRF